MHCSKPQKSLDQKFLFHEKMSRTGQASLWHHRYHVASQAPGQVSPIACFLLVSNAFCSQKRPFCSANLPPRERRACVSREVYVSRSRHFDLTDKARLLHIQVLKDKAERFGNWLRSFTLHFVKFIVQRPRENIAWINFFFES